MSSVDRTNKALQRLSFMGDWLQMKQKINTRQIMEDIEGFKHHWKPYNLRNPNNRWGLSITSLDGKLSGVPDLDSLLQYNKIHGTSITNHHIKEYTEVYKQSEEIQKLIAPWKPWLGRCHFLKLNTGGYFPEHYDINKIEYGYEEIRLIAFINNCNKKDLKFIYEDTVRDVKDGQMFFFNANKRHSVFSTSDDIIMLVFCMKFDEHLFERLIEQYRFA